MSSIVGSSSPFTALSASPDRRLDERFGPTAFETLWSASRSLGNSMRPVRYEMPRVIVSGHRRDRMIAMTVVDTNNAAVAGVILKAFRTLDDTNNSLIADDREGPAVTSAADGTFIVSVPNDDQHYIEAYCAGSPDRAGVTVNTLVGS